MTIRQMTFDTRHLKLMQHAPPFDAPPLGIGDLCCLNSGSPLLLVVDINGDNLLDVTNSGNTFNVLMKLLPDKFKLEIK